MKAVRGNIEESGIHIGQSGVFDDTFRTFYNPLCFYASKFVSLHDAEDIVENLFIRLWDGDQRFESGLHLKNFLYNATKNACLDHLKIAKRADQRYHDFSDGQAEAQIQKDHLHNLMQAEAFAEIYRAVNKLPSQCSTVIRMSYLEGYSNKEIAAALNLSEQTVKNYKSKGLDLLKGKLSGNTFGVLMLLASWHQ